MKTSNIILIAASTLFLGFVAVQMIDGVSQVRQTRELMRPILEEIDSTDIKVICMVRDNDNYIVSNYSQTGDNYIRFTNTRTNPEELRIEGDTLVVTTNKRVILRIPSATHAIEWDGSVRELKGENN